MLLSFYTLGTFIFDEKRRVSGSVIIASNIYRRFLSIIAVKGQALWNDPRVDKDDEANAQLIWPRFKTFFI
jgi:hypothetical protein